MLHKRLPLTIWVLMLSLLPHLLFSQDTIVVQTITLDSDDRVGVFQFPDDPVQSYEKIIMRYQMRCHDAAVGSGNVGCREWDYSCNTFITDSTRVDSNQAQHPRYVISNFSGDEFDYTQQTTYNYTQYEQHQIEYTNILSENTAAIGTGQLPMTLAGDQLVTRAQFLFTASELTTAGLTAGAITSLRMDLTELGSDINFLRIKIKHTSQTELDPDDPDFSGFTEVYFLNTSFTSTGEQPFLFYNNFDWDGTSNLLVEFSYTNQGGGMPTTVNGHDAGFNSSIFTGTSDYALLFAGAGHIPVEAGPLSTISDEVTISMWAYGADNLPVNTTVFEGRDDNDQRQLNVHLPWSNGQVYWDCGHDGTGFDRINLPANESDFKGKWSHWAFTKNANTGDMKIFLNGQLFHSGTGLTRMIDNTSVFNFARSVPPDVWYFGALDEFRIWNAELDQTTIQQWMRRSIDASHPNYNNLLTYFQLDEGAGAAIVEESPNGNNTTFAGAPNWQRIRGKDLYKDFVSSTLRPNISFVQGTYDVVETVLFVLDSVENSQHQVIEYSVDGTDLVSIDTFFVYAAGDQYITDEQGNIVDTISVATQNTLLIDDLIYYHKFPAKYEILSLVTPYGNGLDLGQEGKTFTFDVTDYAPILKGSKRLSVEMGGQNQEELDIRFLFITGTPPREVHDIQNVWPFRRGWYGPIQDDVVFEPRQVMLSPNGEAFKIRSAITGHGQNGEFVQRNHYIDLNGGADEFVFPVWKKCGDIPIYPQGGTWLFDRAGWCPGDPTNVQHLDITPYVTAGTSVEIDYGVLGGTLSEANYLVSNQLVTYGPPNFNFDAAVVDVIRPSRKVEYERFNPACSTPTIVIQNTGATPLTSLMISYQVNGGTALTYEWTGNLAFLETEEVELPIENLSFWGGNGGGTQYFEVTVSQPNGGADAYAQNNYLQSAFDAVQVFDYEEVVLNYKTNNRGEENAMVVRDHLGNTVLERLVMADNTEYSDVLDLPDGCYSLEFTDSGDDGLYYWYWDAIGLNVGSGYLRFRRKLSETVYVTIKSFEPEFGSFVHYDFVMGQLVKTADPVDRPTLLSVYPNPAATHLFVDLVGYENSDVQIVLYNSIGQMIDRQFLDDNPFHQTQVEFDVAHLSAGMYQVQVYDGVKMRYRQVVVE